MENALTYLKASSCQGKSVASPSCLADEIQTIRNQRQTGLVLVSRTPNCFMEAMASDVKRNKGVDTVVSLCGDPVSPFLGEHSSAVIAVANDTSMAFRGDEVTQKNIQMFLTS
jgi:hypothetical protein